jgi:DNA-binding NarL/FixJ family response regulator
MKKIAVLLVDDHEMVRAGLRSLLARDSGIQIVGEAGTRAEAVRAARHLAPDVILMDVRLPDGSGVVACRDIRAARPETRVIMLTSYADDEAVFEAIMAGAAGYFLKQVRGQDLAQAIHAVAAGQSLLDPAVTGTVLARVQRGSTAADGDALPSLSPQEERVLALVAEGKTNKEIAVTLDLSDKTVKNYLGNIFDKLHVSRRAEAAALYARRQGHSAPIG